MYITRARFAFPTSSQLFQLIASPFARHPPSKVMSSGSNQNMSDEFKDAQEMYYWTQYFASKLVGDPTKFNFIELRPEVKERLDVKWEKRLQSYHVYHIFKSLDIPEGKYYTRTELQNLVANLQGPIFASSPPRTGSDDYRVKMLQEMSGELLRRMDGIRRQMEKENDQARQ